MSPVVTSGAVFAGTCDGYLRVLNAGTGALMWTGDLSEGIAHSCVTTSPIAANGLLILANIYRVKAFDLSGCGASVCAPVAKDRAIAG
jgi:outer membrane protein assembly factor BamB